MSLITILIAFLFVLSGCSESNNSAGQFERNDPRYLDEEHVIIQVCKPDKIVGFENTSIDLTDMPSEPEGTYAGQLSTPDQGNMAVIREWAVGKYSNDASLRDVIIASVYSTFSFERHFLIGNTINNQPVYEDNTRLRVSDIVALGVRTKMEYPDDGSYWFSLPKDIPYDRYTDWQEPVSYESRDTQSSKPSTEWELLQGKKLNYYPVEYATAPKMRFKIMSEGDYAASNRFWNREQKALASKYLKTYLANPKPDEVEKDRNLLFAPLLSDSIPSCESDRAHQEK